MLLKELANIDETLLVEAKKKRKKKRKPRIPNVYTTTRPGGFLWAGIGFGSLGSEGSGEGGDGGGGE